VARAAEGGVVVGPRADAKDLQTVDVRDLCPWMVRLIERDASGIFNAAAPPEPWDRADHSRGGEPRLSRNVG
jgi:2'-hydroxyisoflavone reductase